MNNCKFCSDTGHTEQLFVRHKFAAHLILSWGFPVSGEQEILFFFFFLRGYGIWFGMVKVIFITECCSVNKRKKEVREVTCATS